MIEDLLTSYIFEKLDKQIINKVPYCIFFALLIYYFFKVQSTAIILTTIFFVVFLISSFYFNYEVSTIADKMWTNIDVKQTLGRITDIYEKGDSLLKDMKLGRQSALVVSGFLSGVSLTITLTTAFLLLIYYIPLANKQIIIPIAVIVAMFLIYDVAKTELIEEPEKDNNLTMVNDVMNAYLVENSTRRWSSNEKVSKMALALVSRVISPIMYYDFPKMTYKEIFVYRNPKLCEFIKQLCQGHGNLRLKQTDGFSVEVLLVTDRDCDKLSDIVEKEHSTVFPYLLDPEYKFLDSSHKKWTSLQVIKKPTNKESTERSEVSESKTQSTPEEPVGQIFVHAFRIPRVIVDHGRGKPKEKEPQRDVLMFMMMGERSSIQYIYTKVSAMALMCPVQKVISEMEETK